MPAPLTEQDLILLNAYLDGQLPAGERAVFEARLAADATLRAELESLRATVALLGMAGRVPVPRSFTLDPAVYGRPSRSGWWARLGPLPALAATGVMVAAVLVCAGVILLRGGLGGAAAPAPSVALEQAAPRSAFTEEMTAEATEAAAAEAQQPAALAPLPLPTQAASAVTPQEFSGGVGGGPPSGAGAAAPPGNTSDQAAIPSPTPTMMALASPPSESGGERAGEGGNATPAPGAILPSATPPPALTPPRLYAATSVTLTGEVAGQAPGGIPNTVIILLTVLGLLVMAALVIVLLSRRR